MRGIEGGSICTNFYSDDIALQGRWCGSWWTWIWGIRSCPAACRQRHGLRDKGSCRGSRNSNASISSSSVTSIESSTYCESSLLKVIKRVGCTRLTAVDSENHALSAMTAGCVCSLITENPYRLRLTVWIRIVGTRRSNVRTSLTAIVKVGKLVVWFAWTGMLSSGGYIWTNQMWKLTIQNQNLRA